MHDHRTPTHHPATHLHIPPSPSRRGFLGVLSAGVGAAVAWPLLGSAAPAASAPGVPVTIPALREWTSTSGSYTLTSGARIVVSNELYDIAITTAEDIFALTGQDLDVVVGGAQKGDIVLALGAGDALGDEGYRLDIGCQLIAEARTIRGAFWATRTILQMLRQSLTIDAGVACDWPTHGTRAVMVDVARKYYSQAWLEALIRELSYLKYNELHLHLSDDQAFRVESDTVPDAVAPEFYSKAVISELVGYAGTYNIAVVPEFDMPGHMTPILDSRRDIAVARDNGNLGLDLSTAGAWPLARSIIEEYLPLFPGSVWHLGADEWLSNGELGNHPQLAAAGAQRFGSGATGRDLQYDFINQANDLVRDAGKVLRIWNDQLVPGTVITVDSDVEIDHWLGATEPLVQGLLNQGYHLVNSNWNRLYYITGVSQLDPGLLYETWGPNRFALQDASTEVPASPLLAGTQLCIWGEPGNDESETIVASNVAPSLRSVAQRTWGTPNPVASFADFSTIIDTVGGPD